MNATSLPGPMASAYAAVNQTKFPWSKDLRKLTASGPLVQGARPTKSTRNEEYLQNLRSKELSGLREKDQGSLDFPQAKATFEGFPRTKPRTFSCVKRTGRE